MSTIAERIYQAIKRTGLSYADMEKLTGIPKSALHRYATGQTGKCPIDRITAIANACGVSDKWIMGWEQEQQQTQTAQQSVIDSEIQRLYDSLPPEKQEQALQFLWFLRQGHADKP